jgi:hypothetical protein
VRLLIYGFGFTGRALTRLMTPEGWTVAGTHRAEADAAGIAAAGAEPVALSDPRALEVEAARADAILITAPPGPDGCPALPRLTSAIARAGAFPGWIGYLSTTGVYGDRGGRWVTEKSRLAAQSVEGARRVGAERDWLQAGAGMGLCVTVFRLPGCAREPPSGSPRPARSSRASMWSTLRLAWRPRSRGRARAGSIISATTSRPPTAK